MSDDWPRASRHWGIASSPPPWSDDPLSWGPPLPPASRRRPVRLPEASDPEPAADHAPEPAEPTAPEPALSAEPPVPPLPEWETTHVVDIDHAVAVMGKWVLRLWLKVSAHKREKGKRP